MLEIASYLGGKGIDILPNLIARRLYPPSKVARDIRIELSISKDQVFQDLGSRVPFLRLKFTITNWAPVSVKLDRLLINVWFGQPTLHSAVLERRPIRAKKPGQDITFECEVTSAQKQQIEEFYNKGMQGGLTVYYTAYFESRVGEIELIDQRITRNTP